MSGWSGAPLISPYNSHFIGGSESVKKIQEEEQEEEQQKGCLMVMADPSDLGHGKNNAVCKTTLATPGLFMK